MELSEILSSISDEDMKKLQETAKSLLGSGGAAGQQMPNLGGMDPQMLGQISKVASMLNRPDPRCDFLMALKPLLSRDKQGRVDEAMQLLRMLSVLPRIMDLGGRK